MQNIDSSFTDFSDQRHHIIAGRLFRGFGPMVIGVTGGLALFVTGLQLALPEVFSTSPQRYFILWIAAAALSAGLISLEMITRTKHHHGGLADEMVQNTIEQFLPAGLTVLTVAGGTKSLSPWMMGVPFTIGQLMMATVLKYSVLDDVEKQRP